MSLGLDLSGLKALVRCFFIHVTAHSVNSGISMNFTKEYVNIILAIIAVLLYV